MTNKITFVREEGTVEFQSLNSGECFISPAPVSDQVYMKIRHGPMYGGVSLKNGQYYDLTCNKRVVPVSIEVTVTETSRKR